MRSVVTDNDCGRQAKLVRCVVRVLSWSVEHTALYNGSFVIKAVS